MLSTSFVIMLEEFEGPYGNYILEKGLLHVNYVLKVFLWKQLEDAHVAHAG